MLSVLRHTLLKVCKIVVHKETKVTDRERGISVLKSFITTWGGDFVIYMHCKCFEESCLSRKKGKLQFGF